MPFDASNDQHRFPSEKARRLLEAHDREVNRGKATGQCNERVKPACNTFVDAA